MSNDSSWRSSVIVYLPFLHALSPLFVSQLTLQLRLGARNVHATARLWREQIYIRITKRLKKII